MFNTLVSILIVLLVLLVAWPLAAVTGLPDPTRPPDYSQTRTVTNVLPGKRTEFKVNAIRISETDRSAIVNGVVVREGDEIGNARVEEISALEVVLVYERKLLPLPLYTSRVQKQFKKPEENR